MSRPALIEKMFQAGGWLLKPGLVPVDDATIKRNQTAVYVALDSLIRTGGGLAVGKDKRIYVDFSLMPTDAFEELLKSIRVPVWLTGNKDFYVATTGSDTLDAGRGETAEKPFKTIQAAINYVADNYNLSTYSAYIIVAAGTYIEDITLPPYKSIGGLIRIQPAETDESGAFVADSVVIRGCIHGKANAGQWSIYNMTIYNVANRTSLHSSKNYAAVTSYANTDILLYNAKIHLGEPLPSGTKVPFFAQNGGRLQVHSQVDSIPAAIVDLQKIDGSIGTGSLAAIFSSSISGHINITYHIQLGSLNVSSAVASASNNGIIDFSKLSSRDAFPIVSGTVTGKRYSSSTLSIIDTGGHGEEYLPGTVSGTTGHYGQYL